ncbi:MAG: TRAP transporter large permease [Devosia sp.]
MELETLTLAALAALIGMILVGIPIGVALGATALIGTAILFQSWELGVATAGTASFSVLRDYVFATIPLFIIMGNFISESGAARDLFSLMNRIMRRIPARLAVATVLGNAVFAAISGVSVAAAATFSRVAYPEMRRFNYHRPLALGVVAGSSMLGMLIPPSILLIFWGILTEISIGQLFIAGVIPGLLLALMFIVFLVATALIDPKKAPYEPVGVDETAQVAEPIDASIVMSGLGIIGLILLVLGGIWGGLFTPTEAAGVGAVGGLVLAVLKGMRFKTLFAAVIAAGKTTAPIMFLLLTAAMYSRFLVTSGAIDIITDQIEGAGFGPVGLIIAMTIIWLVLGMILDSTSIILLTVPIFAPIAANFGFDPLVFAIYGILIIEAGLLTPPFGLLVYVVKGAVPEDVSLADVFRGSVPYWILIVLAGAIILIFPGLVTFLPSQM